jgi:hypothetical protein
VTVHLQAKPARTLAGLAGPGPQGLSLLGLSLLRLGLLGLSLLGLGLLGLGLLAALAACSSSPASSTSAAALYGTARQQQCTAVSDVLADGPDPDADPVGYAQAQILPLRQLKLSDTALRSAVSALASAYQVYSTSSGAVGKSAATQAAKDKAAVNAICPGAAN